MKDLDGPIRLRFLPVCAVVSLSTVATSLYPSIREITDLHTGCTLCIIPLLKLTGLNNKIPLRVLCY